jgi:hypothetical protein
MVHTQLHVVKQTRWGWDVKRPDAPWPLATMPSRWEAEAAACRILRDRGGGELVMHDADGGCGEPVRVVIAG